MSDDSTPPLDTSSSLVDLASDLGDSQEVSKDLQMLLQRGLHGAKLPKALRSQKAGEAFQSAFEVIGGVTRLALWADKNPDKFYPLFARMIPQTVAPVVAGLPQTDTKNKLDDMPWLTAQRHTYKYQQSSDKLTIEDAKVKSTTPPEGD